MKINKLTAFCETKNLFQNLKPNTDVENNIFFYKTLYLLASWAENRLQTNRSNDASINDLIIGLKTVK